MSELVSASESELETGTVLIQLLGAVLVQLLGTVLAQPLAPTLALESDAQSRVVARVLAHGLVEVLEVALAPTVASEMESAMVVLYPSKEAVAPLLVQCPKNHPVVAVANCSTPATKATMGHQLVKKSAKVLDVDVAHAPDSASFRLTTMSWSRQSGRQGQSL